MNDTTYDPMNSPHFNKHKTKTDLEVLLKEDDAAYLFGNCYAVKASCYECERSIVTPKEHDENTMKKHHKEECYVALKRDKPMFTCVECRKKLNNCRFCLCFDCMQPRILDSTVGRSSRRSKR